MTERPSKPDHESPSASAGPIDVMDPAVLQIHMVADVDQRGPWVHTHGLEAFGLPELEIRGVMPCFLLPAAAGILVEVADYLLNGGRAVSLGQALALDEVTLVRIGRAEPLPGQLDHYGHERWMVVDVPTSYCPLCDEPHEPQGVEPLAPVEPGRLPN